MEDKRIFVHPEDRHLVEREFAKTDFELTDDVYVPRGKILLVDPNKIVLNPDWKPDSLGR